MPTCALFYYVVFQTLATDEHSNILIYMNGHGGDQFLKFHDMEEVSSHDLGGALREMELKKRYHRVRHVVIFSLVDYIVWGYRKRLAEAFHWKSQVVKQKVNLRMHIIHQRCMYDIT